MGEPLTEISREEAAKLGLKRYFTGKPCEHGHIAERYVGSAGRCVECLDNRRKKFRAENPGLVRR